ncbi:MAG: hypothetical protein ABSG68_14815 [Thermoguttaceae bacterium]|jgi:hypothetical protein
MNHVDISFDCIPLRSLSRFDMPVDAPAELVAFFDRLRQAATRHGRHNSYYLHHGQCTFHLANHDQIGMIEFSFEGTILTDATDLKTLGCDLQVALASEVCSWLTTAAVQWLSETVNHAVRIEFDRYIAAGDLQQTIQRMEQISALSDAQGGFLGMGL